MNKKLLFAAMSLAALTACTTDDFESQQPVAEGVGSIQFEVINGNDAMTRASMDDNTIVWSADDGDLFTLYHGAAYATPAAVTGYENATYKAKAVEGSPATLTTPSMIKKGSAIMVWPADTTFTIGSADNLSISIPAEQSANIENELPYVSDLINIGAYAAYDESAGTDYNTAGKDRKYPVYMRPMASQLNLIAEYAGTDETIAELYEGATGVATGEGIDEISVTSVELLTTTGGGTTNFTTEIPVTLTAAVAADNTRWNAAVPKNAWTHITGVDRDNAVTTSDHLSTKCLTGNESAKFLILPQPVLTTGVADAGIVVNTIYGKVVIADPAGIHGSEYTTAEYNNAWYRYLSTRITAATTEENVSATTAEASGVNAGKYKTVALTPALGMQQTINYMGAYVAGTSLPVVTTEPIGVALTRYVNVLLNHLDMSDLHIKTDKQLRDAARVWKKMNLSDVTVYLDGDATTGEFEISQTTIKVINDINASITGGTKAFKVKPCTDAGEVCNTIVITGGGDVQNLTFIVNNGGTKADVAFNAEETWNWKGAVKIMGSVNRGISSFINRGTMQNAETATLKVTNSTGSSTITTAPLVNNGTWNITAGDLNVQFDVTNNGTVNIASGAEYHQDGTGNDFTNEATTLPDRFLATGVDEEIGVVNNSGVFATVNGGHINNYGLIEHADVNAKTYITANQTLNANGFTADADFATAFNKATSGAGNKMGRINLPYSNKDEDNVSVNNAAATGFVSVTISTTAGAPDDKKLDLSSVGTYVNYCIVKGGVEEIKTVSAKINYLEFDSGTTEIAWTVPTATYDGLIVLSPVNIKYGTTVTVNKATYIGAKMYVGGGFTAGSYNGYYGNTTTNAATMYITY